MATRRYALQRSHLPEEESSRPSAITGSDIMAAWLGVLLINAAVMIAIFFRGRLAKCRGAAKSQATALITSVLPWINHGVSAMGLTVPQPCWHWPTM